MNEIYYPRGGWISSQLCQPSVRWHRPLLGWPEQNSPLQQIQYSKGDKMSLLRLNHKNPLWLLSCWLSLALSQAHSEGSHLASFKWY